MHLIKAKVLLDWVCRKVNYDVASTGTLENPKFIDTPRNHVYSSIFLNDLSVCQGMTYGYKTLITVYTIIISVTHTSLTIP